MKIILPVFFLLFGLSFIGTSQTVPVSRTFRLDAGIGPKDYIPRLIIVKFKPSVSGGSENRQSSQTTAPVVTCTLKGVKIESLIKKFDNPIPGGNSTLSTTAPRPIDLVGLDRIYEVRFSGTSDIEGVINDLLKDPKIEYAEPSYIYHLNYIPNDPFYGNQGYLAQIKTPQAWDLIRSASDIIIGIVDSGSDMDHPDLAANIYINTADPVDGLDNDGDGYIDNNKGWDFVGHSGANAKGDNDPSVTSDTTSHGVHVSGIAAAATNNGIGVASTALNAKLLIIKAGADNNGNAIYKGYEGIKYAADHGAQIINCSWGGYSSSLFGQDIINYALNKDCLIIAAAGNENTSLSAYPASYAGVVSVAAVDANDKKSTYSNYGSKVSISAPGNNIYSTFYNNTYRFSSGTSMATSVVASAAALVKAYYPSYTMQQVGKLLIASVDGITSQNPGFNGLLGSGRLNVYRAISQDFTQIITFPALAARTYGDADFDAGASVNSGLPISYSSSNPSVAIIVGGKVRITGAGTTVITASQAGNASFNEAASVSRTLTVNKADQIITFAAIPMQLRGGAAYTLQVSSSSGLPVTLNISDPFIASVSGISLFPQRVGKTSIQAIQPGDTNYLPAAPATQNLQVTDVDGSVVKILVAVSPNNDGINDYLIIEGIKDYSNNHVSVFTANGTPVFQIDNYNNSDHIFTGHGKNGDILPQGTYFYLLQYNQDGSQQRKAGYFVLKY